MAVADRVPRHAERDARAVNRRHFLRTSAAVAAGVAVQLAYGEEKKKAVAANEKINVALVGCGGMGRADLHDFMRLPDFEVVALADPDTKV